MSNRGDEAFEVIIRDSVSGKEVNFYAVPPILFEGKERDMLMASFKFAIGVLMKKRKEKQNDEVESG